MKKHYIYVRLAVVLLSTTAIMAFSYDQMDLGNSNSQNSGTSGRSAGSSFMPSDEDLAKAVVITSSLAAKTVEGNEDIFVVPSAAQALIQQVSKLENLLPGSLASSIQAAGLEDYRFPTPILLAFSDDKLQKSEAQKNVQQMNYFANEVGEETKVGAFTIKQAKFLSDVAFLAYLEEDNSQLVIQKYRSQGYQVEFFSTDKENSGFLLLKGNQVIIAYHGSKSARNWVTNFWATPATASYSTGLYHNGFKAGVDRTWDEVYTAIYNYANQQKISLESLNMTFTGHSLGGALAGVAGMRWAELVNPNAVKIMTFGSPPFGDIYVKERADQLLDDRVIAFRQQGSILFDPVAEVTKPLGYMSIGHQISFDLKSFSEIHKMVSYQKSVYNLRNEDFKADSLSGWKQGGILNPLNSTIYALDAVIKINRKTSSKIFQASAGVKNYILGSSILIENKIKKDNAASKTILATNLASHYEKNLGELQKIQTKTQSQLQQLQKNSNTLNLDAAAKAEKMNTYTSTLKYLDADINRLQEVVRSL
ncbi:MAG: lipase family protein [Nitrosopumilus sp.]|nr:lipase family protein [Nitrosopumilus sp.]